MVIEFYKHKGKDSNKFVEIHMDGYGHYSARGVMKYENGVINYLGDKNLHRWKRKDLDVLLEDYLPCPDDERWHVLTAQCSYCGKWSSYVLSDEEFKRMCYYELERIYKPRNEWSIYIQDIAPKCPAWIRAGAIKNEMCSCNKCNPFK